MVIDFVVSEQDACVQGHFPGAPVVPGAYLLARIDMAVRESLPGRRIVNISKVKFLAPLLPEHRAQLHIDWQTDTRAQVRVSEGETILLQAGITLA